MKTIKQIFSKKNIKWFALLLIIIIVIILLFFRRNVDQVKIENHDLYQYFNGIKVEYTGSIKINKETNNITKITFKDETVDLDSTPLYYKDEEKAIFPKTMSVIYPHLGTQYKVNYFSTIYRDLEDIYVQDGPLNKVISNAVFYDGRDLYFLGCDATVTYGNESYELKAMSYIIVDTYNSVLQIYDKEKDEFKIIENMTDEVIISNSKIKVNATLDLMYYNDKSRLLLKKIDILSNLEK